MKNYQIWNLTTNEMLADNLTFDELPELFGAYADFYPGNEIVACYTEQVTIKRCVKVLGVDQARKNNFYAEWFDLMEELLLMGNIH